MEESSHLDAKYEETVKDESSAGSAGAAACGKPSAAARVFRGIMHGLCAVLLVLACGLGIPKLFGVHEFNVLTGSMSPAYPVGALVFSVPTDPESIQPGDVASCVINDNLDVVTHRVVSNNHEDRTITTKGDANNAEDGPHLYENVVGVVKLSIPVAGGVIAWFTGSVTGRIVGISLVIVIVVLTFLAESIYTRSAENDAFAREHDAAS